MYQKIYQLISISVLWQSSQSSISIPRMLCQRAQTRSFSTKPKLTHTDPDTGKARMVSVSQKDITSRTARAEGKIMLPKTTFDLLSKTTVTKKGDVLTVAQIAGIQAAKMTSTLIPLCHPLLLSNIQVDLKLNSTSQTVDCTSLVECRGNTGVEMEALTAVNVALLTVFDMCKAAGHGMEIMGIKVISKTGGKSGDWDHSKMKEASQ